MTKRRISCSSASSRSFPATGSGHGSVVGNSNSEGANALGLDSSRRGSAGVISVVETMVVSVGLVSVGISFYPFEASLWRGRGHWLSNDKSTDEKKYCNDLLRPM